MKHGSMVSTRSIQDPRLFFNRCYQAPFSSNKACRIDLRLLLAPVLMESNGNALCPSLKTLNSMGWTLGRNRHLYNYIYIYIYTVRSCVLVPCPFSSFLVMFLNINQLVVSSMSFSLSLPRTRNSTIFGAVFWHQERSVVTYSVPGLYFCLSNLSHEHIGVISY